MTVRETVASNDPTGPALEISGFAKAYGTNWAVNGISFSVQSGEVVGLLGPNGSGKTTTMKTIVGIVKPNSGTILVHGMNPVSDPIGVKKIVGYVPETPQLYEFLTGVEYLDFVADMHGIDQKTKRDRIKQFVSALQLEGHENDAISGYSQGMKQKIAITAALLHRPRLLILDEALNGLDPRSARIVKDLISSLADEGVAVLFSTHILEIAEAVCDRVVIMYQGLLVAQGTAVELRQKAGLPGSNLEEVFLKITGTEDLREIVNELSR
jgi:ABC-2 type transport system ATP-binding protein